VRLDEPLKRVVGDKTANALAGLDIRTVNDLLHHYPRRYAERGQLTDLGSLQVGEYATVVADIDKSALIPYSSRPGSLLKVELTDGTGKLVLTFFNAKRWLLDRLAPGRRGLFAGKVEVFNRVRQLSHPAYLLIDGKDEEDIAEFARPLIPIYPAGAAANTWAISRAVRIVLDGLQDLADPVPADVRDRHGLIGLAEALQLVHRPESRAEIERARQRLIWDEAFFLQVALAGRRAAARAQPATPRRPRPDGLLAGFDAQLPFALTAGQHAVSETILAELAGEHPMHRLLQGEVGSGKTVVALRAMLTVVDAGGQAALLAPTEVLAHQHARSIAELLGPLALAGQLGGDDRATGIALLTGSLGAAARRDALAAAANGSAGLVIGTHALLEESVEFADLGLVVVDEQHRFGVEQRDALRAKAARPPHLLVMTATPIPRTVAMTVFGDLDTSVLTELPAGRSPIATSVVPAREKPAWLERSWQRVTEEVAAGHQVYVVCPRIDAATAAGEEEQAEGSAAVLDVLAGLRERELAGLRVEALHGRLPAEAKDDVMTSFAAGRIDVLVATTVIEVGVDVANATVMVVLDADRFGVSQLHQLRGRVGRGSAAGLCLLVTSAAAGTPARDRIDAVAETLDGFVLAELDLQQRREGDVLGEAQSGRKKRLRLLEVLRHRDVIEAARAEALALVAADPGLAGHPELARAVEASLDEDRAEFLEKA